MIYVLAVLLVITITVALYYKDKAKEFESLYELNRDYADYLYTWKHDSERHGEVVATPKLNKDGSIAKKRGRPVGSKKK